MKYTQSGNTYLLVLQKGEEIISALTQFAAQTNLTCATVSGIGATDDAEMGVFDTFEKQYYTKQGNDGNHRSLWQHHAKGWKAIRPLARNASHNV